MTRRIFNEDMRKWSGIILLLVCTPTAKLHTTYGWETNSTHIHLNRLPVNHLNLGGNTHTIDMRSLPIWNGTDIISEYRTHPQLGEKSVSTIQHSTPMFANNVYAGQDEKLDPVSSVQTASQRIAVESHQNIGGGEHLSISPTNLSDQENDNSESENGTATMTSINEKSMNSHTKTSIVNYQDATNDSSQYSNIGDELRYAADPLKISMHAPISSRRSEMINIKDVDTGLMNHMEITPTNDPITDIIYGDEFFATISTLPNVSSSTEQIKIADDNIKSFGEISYSSQAVDREIDVKNGMNPAHSHPNNHNDINNILGRSEQIRMSRLNNSIRRSNVDGRVIVTEPSVIIDNNSIQQIGKQSVYHKKTINTSTSNSNDISETLVKNTDLQLQNITNTSLIKRFGIQSDEGNIPQKIGGDDMLVEKRSHSGLSDNELQEDIEKNITHPEMMKSTNITQIQISVNTTTINSSLKKIFSMPYSGAKNFTPDAKSIFPLMNMTKNLTETSHPNDTNLSSTTSSLTSLRHPLDILLSTSTLPIATTPKFDAVIPATTASGTAERNFITFTTSTLVTMNSSNTSNTIPIDDSSGRLIIVDQTTMSNVEYEFIGLNGTTIDHTNVEITSNLGDNIVKNGSLNDSNMPTQFSNFEKSYSIKGDTFLNTTTHTSATDFDFHDHTILIIDETTTSSSHITAATSYTSILPSIITVDSKESTVTDVSEESTNLDLSDMSATTTSMISSSVIFEYNIEAETSSTIIASATAAAPENSTTVSTVQITNGTTRLVTKNITVFVRMVIETSWSDVCPQLMALRQAIANVLSAGMNKIVLASQVIFRKNPCTSEIQMNGGAELWRAAVPSTLLLYIVDRDGEFDASLTKILPSLYRESPLKLQNVSIRSFQLVEDTDTNNAIAVIVVSCVALICLVLLASLLFVMRKRQTRFNYGARCRPVSLDAYSLDSISAFNSVRRKGVMRMSKRSYGNPAFEDSNVIPTHPLNSAGLATFHTQQNAIFEEFIGIPQAIVRIDELPNGAEIKNRYANVIPLPDTRVQLMKIDNDPLTEYINASYVRGPKNIIKYYIGCQAPMDTTVIDFWRMIWEQQSKVIIMLTDLIENGVEKCAEYIPPSEVTDCYRVYGNFQVTLKKRETKEKYAISALHLKNVETNAYREISHIWYLWPMDGIQMDAAGLIAVLLEARAVQRGDPGPIVVHCSPGTGRTGTLIALDLGIRQYEKSRTVDVPKIVYTIRRDRAGAVQTKEQYCFIYKALNFYATKLVSGGFEST